MADFFRKHSLLLTAGLLLLSCLQLMSVSIRNPDIPQFGGRMLNAVLAPIQGAYQASTAWARTVWDRYLYLVGVEEERSELQHRIEALEAQNSRLIEFESENRRLKQLLSFSEGTGFRGVPSTVIGRDPSNWVRTITIDKGSADGLRPNLAVVDGNALVGQTTVVNQHSAKVLLVTDVTSAVDVIVQGNRTPGIVEGTGLETLRLRYVPKEIAVPVGGRIITAGLGGVYPKGLLVGVVTHTDGQVSGMFQSVEIQPNVDLLRLENVMVIIPEQSAPRDE